MPQLMASLRRRDLDMVITPLRAKESGLENHLLFEDEMVVLVAADHPAAASGEITLTDLAAQPHVVHGSTREVLEGFCRRFDVHFPEITELMLSEAIMEWVAAGLGATMMDRWAARRYLEMGIVRDLRLKLPKVLTRRWYAVTHNDGRPSYVDHFIQLIRQSPPTVKPVR